MEQEGRFFICSDEDVDTQDELDEIEDAVELSLSWPDLLAQLTSWWLSPEGLINWILGISRDVPDFKLPCNFYLLLT